MISNYSPPARWLAIVVFDPMRKALSKLIREIGKGEGWSEVRILDAGCGEGSI